MEDVCKVLFVMFQGRVLHPLPIQENKLGPGVHRMSKPGLELITGFSLLPTKVNIDLGKNK